MNTLVRGLKVRGRVALFHSSAALFLPRGFKPNCDWEKYVKTDLELKRSLEQSFRTNFGHVRLDSHNVPEFHGQRDDFEALKEASDVGSTAQNDFSTSDFSEEIRADFVPKQLGLEDASTVGHQKSFDSDAFLEFQPNLDRVPKIRKISVKTEIKNDRLFDAQYLDKLEAFKHSETPCDEFVPKTKPCEDKATVSDVAVTAAPLNDLGDNAFDEQYFGSLENLLSKWNVGDDVKAGEAKMVTALEASAGEEMNIVDRQMFCDDQEQRKGKGKNTALKFIETTRKKEVATMYTNTRDFRGATKEELVKQLGQGVQNRLFKVATRNERSDVVGIKRLTDRRQRSSDFDEPNEATMTHGRPDVAFLPVHLERLSRVEVEDVFKLSIVYDSNDIVAVNKPYGLAMFGESRRARHTVENLLPCLCPLVKADKLLQVHRLDKSTTGVLLLAKTEEMHRTLTNLFRERKIVKKYWAIVNGTPDPSEGIINIPVSEEKRGDKFRVTLRPDYDQSSIVNKSTFRSPVSQAITEYRTLTRRGNASLVLLQPCTGVKHQIRVHLGFGLNTPVLGDHKYSHIQDLGKPQRVHGDILIRLGVRRTKSRDLPLYLHSKKILIPEVLGDRKTISIDCGLPHFFTKTMKKLKLSPKISII